MAKFELKESAEMKFEIMYNSKKDLIYNQSQRLLQIFSEWNKKWLNQILSPSFFDILAERYPALPGEFSAPAANSKLPVYVPKAKLAANLRPAAKSYPAPKTKSNSTHPQ